MGRLAFVLVFVLWSTAGKGAFGLPPIAVSGVLSSGYRLDIPDEGEETLQMTNTLEISASSYIWQPWLAVWSSRLGFSYVTTEEESRSSSTLASGSGKIDLFPRSHFPMQAFVDVQDSRIDNDGNSSGGSDFRNIRFGLMQRYHPPKSRSKYIARIERNIQEQLDDGSEVINDFLELQASQRRAKHDLSGSLIVRKQSSNAHRSEQNQFVLAGNHRYRSGKSLSISSNANISRLDLRVSEGGTVDSELRLTSSLTWRSQERPMTVRGRAEYVGRRIEQRVDDAFVDSQRLRFAAGVNYDYTEALRLRADLSAEADLEVPDSLTSTQSASLTYKPDSFDLYGFRYNWSLGGGIRNESGSEDESSSISLSGGHSVDRVYRLRESPALNLTVNAGQNVIGSFQFGDESLMTLTHNASATLNYLRESRVISVRLSAVDTLISGETDSHLQVLSLAATISDRINRFSDWNGSFNFGATRSEVEGEQSNFVFSSASARYRHQRLFGIKRLRFQSELSMETEDNLPLPLITKSLDIDWRNRFDYSLGRMDLFFTADFSRDAEAGLDTALFLGIQRSF